MFPFFRSFLETKTGRKKLKFPVADFADYTFMAYRGSYMDGEYSRLLTFHFNKEDIGDDVIKQISWMLNWSDGAGHGGEYLLLHKNEPIEAGASQFKVQSRGFHIVAREIISQIATKEQLEKAKLGHYPPIVDAYGNDL